MRRLRAEAYKAGRSNVQIAAELGVAAKELSYWCSESASRREPPLWAIRKLAASLGLAVVLLPDEVLLTPIDVARALP